MLRCPGGQLGVYPVSMGDRKHQVLCSPDERVAAAGADQTLLSALQKAGINITHACGGSARCSTCRVRVEEGAEFLCPRTSEE